MEQFNTTLEREKFTLHERGGDKTPASAVAEPLSIASNRVAFTVGEGKNAEHIVVRARNTYITLIFASRILREYHLRGAFLKRAEPCDWTSLWGNILSSYEEKYNQDVWGSVYINCRPVYKYRSAPFLDVIEKCVALANEDYSHINETLQEMLNRASTNKTIEYDNMEVTNMQSKDDHVFCNVVCRRNSICTSFDFDVAEGTDREERLEQTMLICAAHLEICDLDFYIDRIEGRIQKGEIDDGHYEMSRFNDACLRKSKVLEFLGAMEEKYEIKYFSGHPNNKELRNS